MNAKRKKEVIQDGDPGTSLSSSTLTHPDLWEAYWNNRQDVTAQERLIAAYMPYTRRTLSRLMIRLPSHVKSEDLLNSALIGLYDAMCRFDLATGMNFEAFAAWRIRGAILDELRACDPLTRTQRNRLGVVADTITKWTVEHDAFPAVADIAEAMGIKASDLTTIMDQGQPWLSLDAPISDGANRLMLGDILAKEDEITPDLAAQQEESRTYLRQAFRKLEDREQKILYLYYFEELRLREIAEIFELTEARVCQLHALAVAKLKATLTVLDRVGKK